MNISRMLKFLVAGIVIGAILFFAGFGVLNLMEESTDKLVAVEKKPIPEVTTVASPTIQVTTSQTPTAGSQASENTSQGQGTSSSPIKIKPLGSDSASSAEPSEAAQELAFGTLTLSTVNSVNGKSTNANFLIENSQGAAIALVKDTSSSTLSLPVGDYKITVSQGGQKVVRFLGVKDGQNGSEAFELDVPVLTGETAEPVTPTTEAVSEGSPTVTPNNAPPETTAVSQAEPSTEAKTNESTATATGGLRLSALTKQGKRPTAVTFHVRDSNDKRIKTFSNVKTQQIILPAGTYKITAETGGTTVVKTVEVLASRGIHEIFMVSGQANPARKSTQESTSKTTVASTQKQQAAPVSSTPSTPPASKKSNDPASKAFGRLELFAQKASNNSPVKSNFYVQKPNGAMVVSKVYVESIGYKLPVGKYKIIVRATGYKNKSTRLNVRANQTRREVFKLDPVNSTGASQGPIPAPVTPAVAPARPKRPTPSAQPAGIAFGGLTVNIINAADGSALRSDIVVTHRDGTPLKQASGVASASFDLPPREFLIRVTHAGLTTSHQVNIVPGKLAIKTISLDADRMSRRERLQRQRRERSQ